MKKWIFIILFLSICFVRNGYGATDVWKNDTAWFVNYGYAASDTFNFTLKLPVLPDSLRHYGYIRIVWGDSVAPGDYKMTDFHIEDPAAKAYAFNHSYEQKGTYKLSVFLYESDPLVTVSDKFYVVHKIVYNDGLKGSIDIVGGEGCMEDGIDSFLVSMVGHVGNPPGTEYKVKVKTDIEDEDFWTVIPLNEERGDTCWVIFKKPTGPLGATIRFDMLYSNPDPSLFNRLRGRTEDKPVYLYGAPKLTDIFNFRDSVNAGEAVADIEVCTVEDMKELAYDSVQNERYQLGDLPLYRQRQQFIVEFFHKDSLNQLLWNNVSADTTMVDTAKMQFKYPGFYKIRMVAWNACGIDSLHTDIVKNSVEQKKIKVYQSGENQLACLSDTIQCVDAKDLHDNGFMIDLIDRGPRLAWDTTVKYEYKIEISQNDEPPINYEDKFPINVMPKMMYKGRDVFNSVLPDYVDRGCDSMKWGIRVYVSGSYKITFIRKGKCGTQEYVRNLYLGNAPSLPADVLLDSLVKQLGCAVPIDLCDTFRYRIPGVKWNNNGMPLDTVRWVFERSGKEVRKDTSFRIGAGDTFLFDSTGNEPNVVRLSIHNYCGWSREEKVEFITRVVPDVSLWRDSVPQNDSLCINIPYDYYLHGRLPAGFEMQMSSSQEFYIGKYHYAPDKDYTATGLNPRRGIKYVKAAEKVYETFKITNMANRNCHQTFQDTLTLLNTPDTIVYNDSIRYCSSLSELNVEKLFAPDKKDFKNVTWDLNGWLYTERLPKLPLNSGANDTLRVKTSNSKGCFVSRQIVLKPQVVPSLALLQDEITVCAEKLWGPLDYKSFIDHENSGKDNHISFSIFKNMLNRADCLLYDSLSTDQVIRKNLVVGFNSPDRENLIYYLKNRAVDTAFGVCEQMDTLRMTILKPFLRINGIDTVQSENTYHFSADKIRPMIDTALIPDKKLTWNYGSFTKEGLSADWDYTLSPADKLVDTLKFELSGKSPCGETMRDTLFVLQPRQKLFGHKDTICESESGYRMWGSERVYGVFVDTASLNWTIESGAAYGQIRSQGSMACFVPSPGAAGQTVKIKVAAWKAGNPAIEATPVYLELYIGEAPVSSYQDIFYLRADGVMDVTKIDPVYGVISGTDTYIWRKADGEPGTWDERRQKYTMAASSDKENVYVSLKGKYGCPSVTDTIVLVKVVPPLLQAYGITQLFGCSEGTLPLDFYSVIGGDKFLEETWVSDGNGSFADKNYNVASDDPIRKICVSLSKENIPFYDNATKEHLDGVNVSDCFGVTIYKKPLIRLKQKYGTICNNTTEILIDTDDPDWITVSPDGYDKGLLSFAQSEGIQTDEFPKLKIKNTVGEAKFIVSADLKDCATGKGVSDTMYITRRKALGGNFDFPAFLCIKDEVGLQNLNITGPYKEYTWKTIGGKLAEKDGGFVYKPDAAGSGQILLNVIPEGGCTDTLKVSKSFTVFPVPDLGLQDDTVCFDVNVTHTIDFSVENIASVAWSANGVYWTTTTAETQLIYSITQADKDRGYAEITAEATPRSGCTNVVRDTMNLYFWKSPEFSDKNLVTREICSGDSLTITGIEARFCNAYKWTLAEGTGALIASDSLQCRYVSGEFSGTARLEISGSNTFGCGGEARLSVVVNVKSAPVVVFDALDGYCRNEIISLTNGTSDEGQEWLWEIGNGAYTPMGTGKDLVGYKFAESGKFAVRLSALGQNGCRRSSVDSVSVHELPLPSFDIPSGGIAGVNKEVVFNNTTPGVNNRYLWKFDDNTESEDVHARHTFRRPPNSPVTLFATNEFNCVDSVVQNVAVIGLADVHFSVIADKCTGEATFTNTTSDTHVTAWAWDFGNGNTSSDQAPGAQNYAASLRGDTTYHVRLTVSNAAGDTTYADSVRIVSKLKAGLSQVGAQNPCETPVKAFVLNETQGRGDLYTIQWGDGQPDSVYDFPPIFPVMHQYVNNSNSVRYFPVTLNVRNECYEDAVKIMVKILPDVVASFVKVEIDTIDNKHMCWPLKVKLVNKAKGLRGSATYSWHLEEGKMPEVHNDTAAFYYEFHKSGNYQIYMVAKDVCGEYRSDEIPVSARGNSFIDFNVSDGPYCSGQPVRFVLADEIKNVFQKYEWDFTSDGVVDSVNKIMTSTTYSQPGKKWITLRGTLDNCPTEQRHSVDVDQAPIVNIRQTSPSALEGCQPLKIGFDYDGYNGGGGVLWDFAGEGSSLDKEAEHVFNRTGHQWVKARLSSVAGCMAYDSVQVNVLKTPGVGFEFVGQKLFCTEKGDVPVELRNVSGNLDPCTYKWFCDDVPVSDDVSLTPFMLNSKFGKVGLKLIARNIASGCSATYTDTLFSAHTVRADFTFEPDSLCQYAPVMFSNRSLHGNRVRWEMGDGHFQTDSVFMYEYEKPGIYQIKLTSRNEFGCEDDTIRQVVVNSLPAAAFTYTEDSRLPGGIIADDEVTNGGIRFTNQTNPSANVRFRWVLNDTVLHTESPYYRFPGNGDYRVTLYAETGAGCRDSVSDVIHINAVKGLFVPNTFAPATGLAENPGTALFRPVGIGLYNYKIQVYDKWGTCVWTSEELENGIPAEAWDGTYKGSPLPKDYYLWKISAVFIDGSVWTGGNGKNQGHVLLIR